MKTRAQDLSFEKLQTLSKVLSLLFVISLMNVQMSTVELGYAHGVGNEAMDILLIAKEGTTLHFDIAPLRVQYFSSSEHLRAIVSTNLKAMIKATRK